MPYTFNPFTGSFDNAPSVSEVEGVYLPLSGGTVTGNLSVEGDFKVGDPSTSITLFVSGNLVGINTETPNEELTVVGDISATGIIYALDGNSDIWNESYSLIQSNSASWVSDSTVDTDVRALTSNWESTYTTVQNSSADWETAYEIGTAYSLISSTFLTSETDSQTLTFDEGTKDLSISNGNTISLSALVDNTAIDTGVRSLTSNWESTYNTVSSLSASWSAADEVLIAQVTNADSVTLNRGDVVYTFGATGDVMSVKLASNSAEATSSKTLGIVNETIAPNGIGYATVAGRIDKMAFPAPFVEGDALWLGSTPGTFTRVKPIAPNHGVYLGVVERANNGNGIAYIKVQNGYELNEIHDVLINGVQAGDVLQRNSSNTLWVNAPLSATQWNDTFTNFSSNSALYVKTVATTTPGTSAVTTIVAVSALPATQVPGTLYILI